MPREICPDDQHEAERGIRASAQQQGRGPFDEIRDARQNHQLNGRDVVAETVGNDRGDECHRKRGQHNPCPNQRKLVLRREPLPKGPSQHEEEQCRRGRKHTRAVDRSRGIDARANVAIDIDRESVGQREVRPGQNQHERGRDGPARDAVLREGGEGQKGQGAKMKEPGGQDERDEADQIAFLECHECKAHEPDGGRLAKRRHGHIDDEYRKRQDDEPEGVRLPPGDMRKTPEERDSKDDIHVRIFEPNGVNGGKHRPEPWLSLSNCFGDREVTGRFEVELVPAPVAANLVTECDECE